MTNPDAMEYIQPGMNASPIVVQVGPFNQFPTNIYSSYLIHEFQIYYYIVILVVMLHKHFTVFKDKRPVLLSQTVSELVCAILLRIICV